MDYREVLHEVENWSIDDRIRLVQDVWDHLVAEGHEPDLSDEMKAELDRRIEELDRNPSAGEPWESVKERVLARLRK